jgi:hypothetical protein
VSIDVGREGDIIGNLKRIEGIRHVGLSEVGVVRSECVVCRLLVCINISVYYYECKQCVGLPSYQVGFVISVYE